MRCLTKFTFLELKDQGQFAGVFAPGQASNMPTRGTFAGFLPLVSTKHTHQGRFAGGL
jgi:hypothetical protein